MSKQETSDFEDGHSTVHQVWAPHCIYLYKASLGKRIYESKAKELIMSRWFCTIAINLDFKDLLIAESNHFILLK